MIIGEIQSVIKTADQSIDTSTVLANATGLVLPIQAGQNYSFQAVLSFALVGIVSGFKFSITGPSSPTDVKIVAEGTNLVTGALATALTITAFGSSLGAALATIGTHTCAIRGTVLNGVNAGNLQIQFAQNTSDGSAITLNKCSSMALWLG